MTGMHRLYAISHSLYCGHALAQPYRFYVLQRLQAIYAALSSSEQASAMAMFDTCGMSEILLITLDRTLGREGNLEVWQA